MFAVTFTINSLSEIKVVEFIVCPAIDTVVFGVKKLPVIVRSPVAHCTNADSKLAKGFSQLPIYLWFVK